MLYAAPTLLALGCVASIVGAAHSGKRPLCIALMLAGVWVGAMLMWRFDMVAGLSILDAIVGFFALWFFVTRADRWAFWVAVLCWLRLGLHVTFDLFGSGFFVGYAHALNATFAAQLAVVFWTGGGGVVSRILHFFRSRHFLRPLRPAS